MLIPGGTITINGKSCRRRAIALSGLLAGLFPASQAWAQTAPPFAQLLNQARTTSRVTALDADVARARGLAEQGRARPNPVLSVYAENFAGDSIRNASNQVSIGVQKGRKRPVTASPQTGR